MKKYIIYGCLIFCSSLLVCCNSVEEKEASPKHPTHKKAETNTINTLFEKKSNSQTHINFKNMVDDNIRGRNNALTFQYVFNGGGVGVADINNDGLQDVYFTGNLVPDELYLNKGNFTFENISKKAGIETKGWSTGVSFVDINNDGFLDIYVCKGGSSLESDIKKNKLFINQGNLTFKEAAEAYGLANSNISTQAAFFDFDKDGDKDCFLMNNAVYKSADIFGNDKKVKEQAGFLQANSCVLYENRNNKFVDISKQAGVQEFSYGLGLLIQDYNNDNYPDIYVANDYYIPDFLFINNQNGTFTNQIKKHTKQTAFYSMGADAADINNDGLMDFAVLDMSSKDHVRNKTLMPSMDVNLFYTLVAHFGFQSQYMFNALQLNNGDGTFSNVAQMAGLANSDWSWSILWADFDLDGWQDCHISNGIKRYLSNNDFRRRIDALNVKANAGQTITGEEKRNLYASMPQLKIGNLAYQNKGDLTFTDQSKNWQLNEQLNSNGVAYADLDNDGDLDLITNNIDELASVFENKAGKQNNFISIEIPYNETNTKVEVYAETMVQSKEYHPVRGYQSSQDHRLNFGLGETAQIDSILVYWQNNKLSKMLDVKANQIVKIQKKKTEEIIKKSYPKHPKPHFTSIKPESIGINFKHKENKYNDFKKEVLLPYLQSTLGPKIAVGDINNDGLDDFYIGGATDAAGVLYIQNKEAKFKLVKGPWEKDVNSEDIGSVFFDADADGDMDLYVTSGGNSKPANDAALADRLYINEGNNQFKKSDQLPAINKVTSIAAAADFDKDGDIDIFVGGRHQPQKYPIAETSYFLISQNGKFVYDDKIANLAEGIGLVNDALWVDIDSDKDVDLIIATEWGPVHVFENENGKLSNQNAKWNTDEYKGWWQSLLIEDIDKDGDVDIIAGNLGLNSKFKASPEKPFKVFSGDFDNNGTHDLFLSKKYKNEYVPVRGFQCASEQMPQLQQQFTSYQSFANAKIQEIVGDNNNQTVLECTTFESGIFINENNSFTFKPLPNMAQISAILVIQSIDVNEDNLKDIVIAGNIYNTEPETPRLDALSAQLLINKGDMLFEPVKSNKSGLSIYANVKSMRLLKSRETNQLLFTVNNNKPILFKE